MRRVSSFSIRLAPIAGVIGKFWNVNTLIEGNHELIRLSSVDCEATSALADNLARDAVLEIAVLKARIEFCQ